MSIAHEQTRGHETPSTEPDNPPSGKQRRGFAAMDPRLQRALASKGGKASHEQGTGHRWTSESARSAGRKGGLVSRSGRRPDGKTPASRRER
jgi:general stress protein YciG